MNPPTCIHCDTELERPGQRTCGDHVDGGELARLAQQRKQTTVNRVVEKVSVGEDLITVLDSPVAASVEALLENLAALVVMSDPNRSKNPDNVRRSAEVPLVDVAPAKASKRLDQAERVIHLEAESVAGFLHKPWTDADELRSKQRVSCPNQSCDRHGKRLPRFVRADGAWLDIGVACLGCGGRLVTR